MIGSLFAPDLQVELADLEFRYDEAQGVLRERDHRRLEAARRVQGVQLRYQESLKEAAAQERRGAEALRLEIARWCR